MYNRIITLTAGLLAVLCANAQNYNALDEVKNDRIKASGMEAPYTLRENALTATPEGYAPFYVSHYGRHGSRYASSSDTYKTIRKALREAHKKDNLTELGESFYERYEAFYKIPLTNTGDLVPLGCQQHAAIASYIYDAFPEVFKGSCKVVARASTSQRCIVSMAAFCTSLQKKNPEIEINLSSNHMGMCDIVPASAPSDFRKKFEGWGKDRKDLESTESFSRRTVDYDAVLGRIFKDYSFLKELEGGEKEMIDELYEFLGNYQNYEDVSLFEDIVVPEQYCAMWEAANYGSFMADYDARFRMIPLLADIVSKGDAAIEGEGPAADLRFGHDYILEAFNCLLNINGCGTIPETADEVKYWFQSYNIPMAANIQFVLYKPEKSGEILFKLLWNGAEATLPGIKPVSGPYYRWNDFKALAEGIFKAHPEVL